MAIQQLENRIRELEKKLARITTERDELAKDVENLCLQTGSSKTQFSSSQVLVERVTAAEAELKRARAQLRELSAERDACREDLVSLRLAKQAADKLLTTERDRSAGLEKELAFYQVQVTKAVESRDLAVAEMEQAKVAMAHAEQGCLNAQAQAAAEVVARRGLEMQLEQAHEQIIQLKLDLSAKTTECNDLLKKFRQSGEATKKAEAANVTLQVKVDECVADLERTKRQLQQFRESEGGLRVKLQEAAAIAAQLQGTVAGQQEQLQRLRGDLVARCAELDKAHADLDKAHADSHDERLRLDAEIASLHDQLSELRSQLTQKDQELTQWQLQWQRQESMQGQAAAAAAAGDGSSAAGGAHAHSGVGEDEKEQLEILTQMVKDLKIKLAQATQEKVEALLKVAAASSGLEARPNAARSSRSGTDSGPLSSSPAMTSMFAAFMSSRFGGLSALTFSLNGAASAATAGAGQAVTSGAAPATGSQACMPINGALTSPDMGSSPRDLIAIATDQGAAATAPTAATASQLPASALTHAMHGAPRNGASIADGGLTGPAPTDPPLDAAQLSAMVASLQAQLAAARKVAELARSYLSQLQRASKVLWSTSDAAKKCVSVTLHGLCTFNRVAEIAQLLAWVEASTTKRSALSELTKLHAELNRMRACMGLPLLSEHHDDHGTGDSQLRQPSHHHSSAGTGKDTTTNASAAPHQAGGGRPSGHHYGCVSAWSKDTAEVERELMAEVLAVVDFGLMSLEQYNRQEAIASIMHF